MGYENVIKANKARTKHGLHNTRVYGIWQQMIQRCYNPNNRSYKRYGCAGITVCDEWRYSFEQFFADMGHPPEGMTLDRVDNTKGYLPSNCRWSTPEEQANNRKTNVRIEYKGVTKTIAGWARHYGIPYHWIKARYKSGVRPPELFSTKNRKGESVKYLVSYEGKQVSLKELADLTGVKLQTLYYRLRKDKPLF